MERESEQSALAAGPDPGTVPTSRVLPSAASSSTFAESRSLMSASGPSPVRTTDHGASSPVATSAVSPSGTRDATVVVDEGIGPAVSVRGRVRAPPSVQADRTRAVTAAAPTAVQVRRVVVCTVCLPGSCPDCTRSGREEPVRALSVTT